MKRSQIIAALSCDLLQFVRDSQPDEMEFVNWLGGPQHADRFHTLRKAGVIEIENGRYVLSSKYVIANGSRLQYEDHIYEIDTGVVSIIRRTKKA